MRRKYNCPSLQSSEYSTQYGLFRLTCGPLCQPLLVPGNSPAPPNHIYPTNAREKTGSVEWFTFPLLTPTGGGGGWRGPTQSTTVFPPPGGLRRSSRHHLGCLGSLQSVGNQQTRATRDSSMSPVGEQTPGHQSLNTLLFAQCGPQHGVEGEVFGNQHRDALHCSALQMASGTPGKLGESPRASTATLTPGAGGREHL